MITDQSTLKEAKDFLRDKLKSGETCPCCNRYTQMYSRSITSSMVYALVLMYNRDKDFPGQYFHVEEYLKNMDWIPSSVRGDFPKMRFWDLIRPKEGGKEDGNPNTGYYKITELGKTFVEGNIELPSNVNIYNNRFFGFDKESKNVSVHDCIKNKFSYNLTIKK
jgi:hypothetical protein